MLNLARGVVISIVLVLVSWWALQGSQTFKGCVQQDPAQTADNKPENNVSAFVARANLYRDCLGDFLHDRKDETLVAFTVILAFSTIFLWVATRDIVSGAERTAKSQLRAYVGIASGHLAIEIVDGKIKPTVTIRVRNFGQTPAYEVHSKGSITLASKFSDALSGRLISISGKNAIFPQSSQRIRLTQDLNAPTGEGPLDTFVFGYITYKDVFGHLRRTNFRFTCQSDAIPDSPGPFRADLAPCEEGNEAT
jgi:hypothetical protein